VFDRSIYGAWSIFWPIFPARNMPPAYQYISVGGRFIPAARHRLESFGGDPTPT
jgi:hypothetical protein